MYDLIIIGGGPAGLTAMVYAIRKHLNALLISQDLGGKTNYHLELPEVNEYRVIRGAEIVDRFKAELEYLDFARHLERVVQVRAVEDYFVIHTQMGGELPTRAAVIATGARPQRLHVPGEDQFLGKGMAYSAMSYAHLMVDKVAAVVGDGELALRSAAELAIVAKQVYLVGAIEEALNSDLGQKIQQSDRVSLFPGYALKKIAGNVYAERILITNSDDEQELPVDCTFIEKQLIPNSEPVKDLLICDDQGRIEINCRAQTSVPGIFAAGDVTNLYAEQVLIAVGEGAKAALSAYEFLLPKL